MFRLISIIAFIFIFSGAGLHLLIFRPNFNEIFGKDRNKAFDVLRIPVYFITLLLVPQKLNLLGALRKLIYLLAILCVLVLTITGFVPHLIFGVTIHSYWLMIHATFAPVFAICVAALAVMWAHNCQFNKNYWPWLNKILPRKPKSQQRPQPYELSTKICFWLILVLTLPVILSAVSSMFPIFGTEMQVFLMELHRYTALLLLSVAIAHTYLTVRARMKQ